MAEGMDIFEFEPEASIEPAEWTRLADAIEANRTAVFDWAPSNGTMVIRVAQHCVEFHIAKYGDGLGGTCVNRVPKRLCVPAFRSAAVLTPSIHVASDSE
jgi:hypothetical protein